jgi:hypothetical protein
MYTQKKDSGSVCRADWSVTLRKAPPSASPRCEAMKRNPLKADPLKVHTKCNVSELYFDVKTILRRHQGRDVNAGVPTCYSWKNLKREPGSSPAATLIHLLLFYSCLLASVQMLRLWLWFMPV